MSLVSSANAWDQTAQDYLLGEHFTQLYTVDALKLTIGSLRT